MYVNVFLFFYFIYNVYIRIHVYVTREQILFGKTKELSYEADKHTSIFMYSIHNDNITLLKCMMFFLEFFYIYIVHNKIYI